MKGAGLLLAGILLFSGCTLFDELLEPNDVLSQVLDNAVPGVGIVSPANGYITLNPEITLTGTANMDKPFKVVRVQVQLNNGVWEEATGTAAWSKGLTLIEGSNAILARAISDNGETNTCPVWAITASKYGWTHRIGGSSDDTGKSVKVDGEGNVYLVGYFNGTVDFAADWGQTDIINSASGTDIFITKINADGSYGWTHRIGGSGTDWGNSVAVDTDGNVYITGYFDGNVDFGNDWGVSDSKASIGRDIFITKISNNGDYCWTHRMGGTGSDQGNSVTVDTAGNIYLTGSFNSTVVFDADWGGADTNVSTNGADIFITKISADGNYGWTHRIGGGGNDYGNAIAVDLNGNVFITGIFQTNNYLDFGEDFSTSDVRNYSGKGQNNIFVTKIHGDGSYEWTRVMGIYYNDDGNSIAVDTNGDVYVTGYFNDQVVFGADWSTTKDEKNAIQDDAFVMKILSDGSYGWAKRFGSFLADVGNSIAISKNGNIYFVGSFNSTINFADDYMQADYKTNAGNGDTFITKINADGTYGWTKRFGGPSSDIGYGVAVDGNDNVYLTGCFYSDSADFGADFYGSDVITNSSSGMQEIFITKIAGW